MTRTVSGYFKKQLKRVLVALEIQRLSKLTPFDYIRVGSLERVAEEIYANSVAGSVAELGVYKGDFAKHINSAFPDRKLYLFDTFAGFSEKDKDVEIGGGFSAANENFSDTSIELVVKKMEHPKNLIIRAGYFPESIQDADKQESFAFVSLDADLYKPIYEGLQFFYPRLNKGGYIFVHDYNYEAYPGAKLAVRNYCREQGIHYFPLLDPGGSAIIAKG